MPDASVPAWRLASDDQRRGRWLAGLMVIAVAARIAARLPGGAEAYRAQGYSFYLAIADNFLRGDGLCYAPGVSCAGRPPLYSLFIAPFAWLGVVYPGVAMAEAAMGGAMVWVAWWIGRRLFGATAGMLAAAATALNPYAVAHDAALQDSVLLNLLLLATLALLIRAMDDRRLLSWLTAGGLLALAVMTSSRAVIFVPCALAWIIAGSGEPWRQRVRAAGLVAIPVAVLAGGWMARNFVVVGAPVFTTESGMSLFWGNSPLTFLHYPQRSIDLTAGEMALLPAETLASVDAFEGDQVAADRALRDLALGYWAADPVRALRGAVRKTWVVASAELSPARGPFVQWGYRLLYLPIHLLALAGMWRAGSPRREQGVLLAFLLAFMVTSAIYWAHTSHKSLIDPVLFIYAAGALTRARTVPAP